MIVIPTSELIGGITDVLGLAPQTKDTAHRGIVIEWSDRGDLSFAAYDTFSGGVSTWTPFEGDESDVDDEIADEIRWGGADDPWKVFISYDDAREIVKVFKLPSKDWRVPVSIKVSPTGSRLIVERSRDARRRESVVMVPTDLDELARFPDVREMVYETQRQSASGDREISRDRVTFSGARLGAFANVRAHGLTELIFNGYSSLVAVRLGARFTGFIYPDGVKPSRNAKASDLLRYGSGVHVTPAPAGPRPIDEDGQDDLFPTTHDATPFDEGMVAEPDGTKV